MSEKLSKVNCEKMIQQLGTFASDVSKLAHNMETSLNNCKKKLSASDKSMAKISAELNQVERTYLSLAKQAGQLALEIQEQVDIASKEDPLWED